MAAALSPGGFPTAGGLQEERALLWRVMRSPSAAGHTKAWAPTPPAGSCLFVLGSPAQEKPQPLPPQWEEWGRGRGHPPPLCPCSSQLTVPAEGQTDHTPEAMLGPGLLWGLHPVGVSVSSCLGPQRRKASGGYGKGKRSQGRCSLSSAAETSVCLDPGLRVPACACLCGGDGPGGLGQASCPPACLWATVCESGSGTHFVLG